MLKGIQSTQEQIEVMTKLGSDIDTAKKECQFIATILQTNVVLYHNADSYLIDSGGNCIKRNNQLKDMIDICK